MNKDEEFEIEYEDEIEETPEEVEYEEEIEELPNSNNNSISNNLGKATSLNSFNTPNTDNDITKQANVPANMPSNRGNRNNGEKVPEKLKNGAKTINTTKNIKNGELPGSSPNNIDNLKEEKEKKEDNSNQEEKNEIRNNKQSNSLNSNSISNIGNNASNLLPKQSSNKNQLTQKDAETAVKGAMDIAAGNKVKGAIELGKVAMKTDNPIKKKVKRYAYIVCGIFLAIVIIYFAIMTAIIENMEKIKEFLGQTVQMSEKSNNIYSGLGFKTTDEAFYDELEKQYNLAGGEIDLALVMSALLYTETTNDNSTDFSLVPEDDKSLLNQIISELPGVSTYSQGQILRARMLCKGMTESTEGEKVTFSEFVRQYGDKLKINADALGNVTIATILTSSNPLISFVNSLKDTYNSVFGPEFVTADNELVNGLSEVFDTTTMGLKSITNISFGLDENNKPQVYVTMQVKKYSEDKFKNYLSSYYIRKMPEFKTLTKNLSGTALDAEIDHIIKEIYDHRDWYVEIFGKVSGNSENYSDVCTGAIEEDLVSLLGLPVSNISGSTVFDGKNAYGVSDGVMHNGVDLNVNTTGNKEGDNVISIAAGKVVSVTKSNANTPSSIKIKHSIIVDGTTYDFYSVYIFVKDDSIKVKNDDKVRKGDTLGTVGINTEDNVAGLHFEFHNENDNPIDPTNLFIKCDTTSEEGTLAGSDNEEKIWFFLRNKGYSEIATAAAMGNFMQESGLSPITVQEDYKQPDPEKYDLEYTANVDSGKISKNDFVYNGPNGGGYGLAQWTWKPTKKLLYEYMKKEKTSIGDLQMQLNFFIIEVNKSGNWASESMKKTWLNSKNLNAATEAFCDGFEKPSAGSLPERQKYAKEIYNRNKGKKAISSSSVSTSNVKGQSKMKGASNKEKLKYVFPDGVPTSESQLKKYLTDVKVPITTKQGTKTTTTVTVHKAIANDVVAALTAAQKEGFVVYEIGGYRKFGSDSAGQVSSVGLNYSQHCFGLAVDINVNENCYKKPPTAGCSVGSLYSPGSNPYSITKSGALYKSFISNGWGWGGEWTSLKDYMHFSFFGT